MICMKISDSFYKMEYDTKDHRIFDIYEIGHWYFTIADKPDVVFENDIVNAFRQVMKYFPWLIVSEFSINSRNDRWALNNGQTLDEYLSMLLETEAEEKGAMEWDLATIECLVRMEHNNDVVFMPDKKNVSIDISFDPEYKTLICHFLLKMDYFTNNPSRQPGVHLSGEEVAHNNSVLSQSLAAIDADGVFHISFFESPFHHDKIYKYGFKY